MLGLQQFFGSYYTVYSCTFAGVMAVVQPLFSGRSFLDSQNASQSRSHDLLTEGHVTQTAQIEKV